MALEAGGFRWFPVVGLSHQPLSITRDPDCGGKELALPETAGVACELVELPPKLPELPELPSPQNGRWDHEPEQQTVEEPWGVHQDLTSE